MSDGAIKPEDRHVSPYSTHEKVGRMAWALVQATLFRFSLPTAYGSAEAELARIPTSKASAILTILSSIRSAARGSA